MSERRISLHPTAVSQPCTNCGVHGHWSEVGRKGTFTPPPGHTLREDGTIACPNPSGWLRADAVPKSEPITIAPLTPDEQHRELLCDYLRLHGIDPDQVPADAYADVNLIKRTLSIDTLVCIPTLAEPNKLLRRRVTVDLIQTMDEFRATPR